MKKEMLFTGALLLSTGMYAEQEVSFDDIKKEADTIVYTLTITKEPDCEEAIWNKIIEVATRLTQRDISDDEMVDKTLEAMKESYEIANGADGIHGSFDIGLGDRSELIRGCDGICGGDDKDR